ncbi:MAG: EamA family transporter [Oscillospiraceae bacterium]|nr:EamA family transporter [Oscillospiraceae bacterium]
MIYLVFSILCSTMAMTAMRLSANHIRSKNSMLTVNYLISIVLAGIHTAGELFPATQGIGFAAGLGAFNGAMFFASLILFQYNTTKNGLVLTTVFSKVGSLVVPIVIALCLFADIPTAVQIVGAIIAIIAIVAINYDGEKGMVTAKLILPLQLLVEGVAASVSKVFEEMGVSALSENFLLYTYIMASLIGIVLVAAKREKPSIKDVFWGLVLGIPNFYSMRFMLMALKSVSAVIVYPTHSVVVIALVTLGGIMLFKERLSKRQWLAMVGIVLSVVLLNI